LRADVAPNESFFSWAADSDRFDTPIQGFRGLLERSRDPASGDQGQIEDTQILRSLAVTLRFQSLN
jgi:hypothetical protein